MKMENSFKIEGIEKSFDNNEAVRLLSCTVTDLIQTSDIVRKSIYDFDLDSPEGISKLLSLLPIMDPNIITDLVKTIWPGYEVEDDPRRHRMDIKGYLKDYLESLNEEAAEEPDNTARPSDAAESENEGAINQT
jgi:hypothetical protein